MIYIGNESKHFFPEIPH